VLHDLVLVIQGQVGIADSAGATTVEQHRVIAFDRARDQVKFTSKPKAQDAIQRYQQGKMRPLAPSFSLCDPPLQQIDHNNTTHAKIVSLAFGPKNIYLRSWQSVHN
jgi:Zn-dependent alcohol dehydrogenase